MQCITEGSFVKVVCEQHGLHVIADARTIESGDPPEYIALMEAQWWEARTRGMPDCIVAAKRSPGFAEALESFEGVKT